jgi:N-acetylmuramoyl-L-alanine amidase
MKPVLIIDPGHGGRDPGGGSNEFWLEKDMVLDISLYQFKRFRELGVPVDMTRMTDIYLSPEERTRLIRNSGAKYCISNHINAGGGDGVETIHSIFADDVLAAQLAQEIVKEGQNLRRVFTRTLPYDRNKDYYFMHRDTGAVNTTIVEYGFADSKKDDVKQLQKHWQNYAEAVVRGFCQHIGHPYRSLELPKVQARVNVVYNERPAPDGYLIDNTTYVPLRFVMESVGAKVTWDQKSKTAFIERGEK